MLRRIPIINTLPAQRFMTALGGQSYRLRVTYVRRTESWYLDVETLEGVALVSGIRLTNGISLLASYVNTSDLPTGILGVMDRQETREDPGRDDLGVRHELVYIEED